MAFIREKGLSPGNTFLERLKKKFHGNASNFILGNAEERRGYPIVYCSDGFCELTGFTRREINGKGSDCTFLYGMGTNYNDVNGIRKAFIGQEEFRTEILLYAKSGSQFWCLLDIAPIKNEKDDVVLFLVSHKVISHGELQRIRSSREISGRDGITHYKRTEKKTPTESHTTNVRKFSRDVLFHLQRKYHPDEKKSAMGLLGANVRKDLQFKSDLQYKSENIQTLPRFMLLHFGRPRLVWDWIMFVIVAYFAVTVPYSSTFQQPDNSTYVNVFVDMLFESFFVCDVVINFRTTFVDPKNGKLVTRPCAIAKYYMKGWFVVDLLAALPFELIYLAQHSWGSMISVLKLPRLIRLIRVGHRLTRYIEYTPNFLVFLVFSFTLVSHWVACIWFVIGNEELKRGEQYGWLAKLGKQFGKQASNDTEGAILTQTEEYVSALYFSFTSLTTIGFGNIAPTTVREKIFAVIIMLIGALVQSAIFGNITVLIQKIYASRAKFHNKSAQVREFVKNHEIGDDLKRRVEDWFISHWSCSKGIDNDKILRSFPKDLQADICLHTYRSLLSLPIFNVASRDCHRLIALNVRKTSVYPGELIVKENDAITSIYFVKHGMLEVIQEDYIVAIIGSGEMFGEDITNTGKIGRSNGDVRALMNCDLLTLDRDTFKELRRIYPDFVHHFHNNVELSFDMVKRQDFLNTRRSLAFIKEEEEDSIQEEDEDYYSSSDADEDEDSDSDRSCNPPSNTMPLWQRQLSYDDANGDGNDGRESPSNYKNVGYKSSDVVVEKNRMTATDGITTVNSYDDFRDSPRLGTTSLFGDLSTPQHTLSPIMHHEQSDERIDHTLNDTKKQTNYPEIKLFDCSELDPSSSLSAMDFPSQHLVAMGMIQTDDETDSGYVHSPLPLHRMDHYDLNGQINTNMNETCFGMDDQLGQYDSRYLSPNIHHRKFLSQSNSMPSSCDGTKYGIDCASKCGTCSLDHVEPLMRSTRKNYREINNLKKSISELMMDVREIKSGMVVIKELLHSAVS